MNEYVETAVKIKDTVSEFIPAKLSVIIKLAELAFDTFGKVDDSLNSLYKKAFKEAVENVAKDVDVHNIRELLRNCGEINSLNDVQNLNEYLKKISAEMGIFLSEKELLQITGSIVERFDHILLEDKYDKLYKWFLLCRNQPSSNSDIKDIKEILNALYDRIYRIGSDNKSYAKDFVRPLFMHRTKPVITLKDVFVMPNVNTNDTPITFTILNVIREFINTDLNVLFIEGYGGYGKSSIVSFLAYNYLFNNASPDISFLANKQLIIIRLRDINKDNKIKNIEEKLNNIGDIEDDAVLIFDGLDELCMMDNDNGSVIAKDIIKTFFYYNRKIIITTRPTCINYSKIAHSDTFFSYSIAEICSFDENQREAFADSFAKIDNKHIEAVEYVKNLPFEKCENESIYGSPFLLYLILSGGLKEEEKDNSWLLMHRLFHDELFNPSYSYDRGIDIKTADKIYQFNCDIAYEMFKTKNKKLFMTSDELKEILPNDDIKDIVKDSHGLFSYMRKSNDGTVEFVHNHIRDYFLCEKVLREINTWYLNKEIDGYQIASNLGKLLNYDFFTNEVKLFIKEAIRQNKTKKLSIYKNILDKSANESLSNTFDWFYKSGGLVNYDIMDSSNRNYMELSYYAINNSAYIYKIIYELEDQKYMHWISNEALDKAVLNSIFEMFKKYLNNAYLSKIYLRKACLDGACLSKANLCEAYLSNADLRNADLRGTDLYKADLHSANLSGADLRKANLNSTDLRAINLSEADLSEADLSKADLYGAKLHEADLCKACLSEADLCETNLCKAILNGANLVKANLSFANLDAADFRMADLSGANLNNATNISKAIFGATSYDDSTQFPRGFMALEPEFIKIDVNKDIG